MDRRWKAWGLGSLGITIVLLILVSAGLPQLQFRAGQPFWLPDVGPGAGGGPFASSTADVILLIVRGVLALAAVGLPVYIVISLLTGEGRRRLLGEVIALTVIILMLTLLSRSAQSPEEQETLRLPPFEAPTPSAPAGPPAEFTANVPPWIDVVAAPVLAVIVSGAVVVLWWVWNRAKAPPDTLDQVAEQAQMTIDALHAGEAFDDVIIRCYVQLTRIVQEARNIRRDKAMTPSEFEQFLLQRGFPAQPVRDLTRLFERARYGHKPAGDLEERQAIASLEAITAFCKSPGDV